MTGKNNYFGFLDKIVYIEYLTLSEKIFKYEGVVTDISDTNLFLKDKYNQPVSLELRRIKTCVVKKNGLHNRRD